MRDLWSWPFGLAHQVRCGSGALSDRVSQSYFNTGVRDARP